MKFKKFAAIALTAVLTVTAFTPVTAQAEYDEDESYSDDWDPYEDDSDDEYWNDGGTWDDSDDDTWDDDDDYQGPDYSQLGLAQTSLELKSDYDYDYGYNAMGSIQLTGVPEDGYLDEDDIDNLTSSNKKMSFGDYGFDEDSLWFVVYGNGTTTVSFSIKDKQLSFTLRVAPRYDFSKMKLAKKSVILMADNDWDSARVKVKLKGLPAEAYKKQDFYVTSVKSSNKKIDVSADYDSGKKSVIFSVFGHGTTRVTIKINGVKLKIKIRVVKASMKKDSYYLATGKSDKLQIKGNLKGVKVKYKSLSPSVASVDSKGKVKAKKAGTAVIKVTVGGKGSKAVLGTVINVASYKKLKVFNWAKNYASKDKYSQAKRMQNGFYDCSSLVWRAYSSQGIHLLYNSYAPTAADLGKYLDRKGKRVGSASESNFQKEKFQVGDLLFKTGAKNGRYKGIYHVEMFGGYSFGGFNGKGKPYLNYTYANLQEGSGSSNFICRP